MNGSRKSYWKTVFLAGVMLVVDVAAVVLRYVKGSIILLLHVLRLRQDPGLYHSALVCSGLIALFCFFIVLGGLFAIFGDAGEVVEQTARWFIDKRQ